LSIPLVAKIDKYRYAVLEMKHDGRTPIKAWLNLRRSSAVARLSTFSLDEEDVLGKIYRADIDEPLGEPGNSRWDTVVGWIRSSMGDEVAASLVDRAVHGASGASWSPDAPGPSFKPYEPGCSLLDMVNTPDSTALINEARDAMAAEATVYTAYRVYQSVKERAVKAVNALLENLRDNNPGMLAAVHSWSAAAPPDSDARRILGMVPLYNLILDTPLNSLTSDADALRFEEGDGPEEEDYDDEDSDDDYDEDSDDDYDDEEEDEEDEDENEGTDG